MGENEIQEPGCKSHNRAGHSRAGRVGANASAIIFYTGSDFISLKINTPIH
jgi:hypothetical protein